MGFCSLPLATLLKQSKQIKVLQGITLQNTACVLDEYNIYKCLKSRGSEDLAGLWQQQELSFSEASVKIEQQCVCECVSACAQDHEPLYAKQDWTHCACPLSVSLSELTGRKEGCRWLERRNPRKLYCKRKITQCEKCKSTVGNWAITAWDYVKETADAGGG